MGWYGTCEIAKCHERHVSERSIPVKLYVSHNNRFRLTSTWFLELSKLSPTKSTNPGHVRAKEARFGVSKPFVKLRWKCLSKCEKVNFIFSCVSCFLCLFFCLRWYCKRHNKPFRSRRIWRNMQIPARLLVFNIRKCLVTVLPWRWEQCSNTLTTGFDTLQTLCLLPLCVSGCSLSQPTTQNFPHHTHRKSSRMTQQVSLTHFIIIWIQFRAI